MSPERRSGWCCRRRTWSGLLLVFWQFVARPTILDGCPKEWMPRRGAWFQDTAPFSPEEVPEGSRSNCERPAVRGGLARRPRGERLSDPDEGADRDGLVLRREAGDRLQAALGGAAAPEGE